MARQKEVNGKLTGEKKDLELELYDLRLQDIEKIDKLRQVIKKKSKEFADYTA